jgi:hypothetical protein
VKTIADIAFEMSRFVGHATLLLTLAGCLTGCLIIPTPHSDSGYARTNVDLHTPEQFTPGVTTRQDIIMALGEPDAVSWDECQMAYRSEKIVGLWMFGGYGGGDAGTIYKDHFYFFEFDLRGRFQTVTKSSELSLEEGVKQPRLNSLVFKSVHTNGVPAMFLGDPVRCEHPKSFWLAGVDGYGSKGAKSMVGRPGLLLLTQSNLIFVTAFQFANAGPALMLPLESVAEVRLDEWSARRLVVRLSTGAVHSFEINRPGSVWQDKPAMQAACDFIQSKIKTTQLEK